MALIIGECRECASMLSALSVEPRCRLGDYINTTDISIPNLTIVKDYETTRTKYN
jgi:hypothetical protein